MADWQRMKTAPKDGTAILALLEASDIPHSIRWDADLACWTMTWDGYELTQADGPRYWMACPDDPDADGVASLSTAAGGQSHES